VERYGGVYEHSPWVAASCYADAAGLTGSALASVLAACVNRAGRERQLALIRAHPDLAGRAAVAGKLSAESTSEQSSAGIEQCTPEEYRRFMELNEAYRRKFDFPFVMAVRHSNRRAILAAFERRLQNDADEEFATALTEVHKIARLRLGALD
jgi:OHCU decarboxylase